MKRCARCHGQCPCFVVRTLRLGIAAGTGSRTGVALPQEVWGIAAPTATGRVAASRVDWRVAGSSDRWGETRRGGNSCGCAAHVRERGLPVGRKSTGVARGTGRARSPRRVGTAHGRAQQRACHPTRQSCRCVLPPGSRGQCPPYVDSHAHASVGMAPGLHAPGHRGTALAG